MIMSSHSWLLMVTVALCATVIHAGRTSLSLTDDPILNKILSTTEDSKPNAPIKKWAPDPKIPLAENTK